MDCSSPYTDVTSPGSTIVSPNYPSNYTNNLRCQTTVRFPSGQRVNAQFLAFDLESDFRCRNDWLVAYDGPSTYASVIGSKRCGSSRPSSILSSGNSLTFEFRTDFSQTFNGFKILVTSGKQYLFTHIVDFRIILLLLLWCIICSIINIF